MIIYYCLCSLLDQILYQLLHGIRITLNFTLLGTNIFFGVSGFRHEVDENRTLLSNYAVTDASGQPIGSIFKCQELKKWGR
jgi:hypothetical protein